MVQLLSNSGCEGWNLSGKAKGPGRRSKGQRGPGQGPGGFGPRQSWAPAGLGGARRGPHSSTVSQNFCRITAAWARVAVPAGVRVTELVPLMSPWAQAQLTASRA